MRGACFAAYLAIAATSGCVGVEKGRLSNTPCPTGLAEQSSECGTLDEFGLPTTTAVTNFAPVLLPAIAVLGAAAAAGIGAASGGGGTNGTNSTN